MRSHANFPNLFVTDHPLIQHKLTEMRDVSCSCPRFKGLLREIAMLIGYEITRSLPLTERVVRTPLCEASLPTLAREEPVIVPILRAGLGMTAGLEELMPNARMGHIGLYRDHDTKRPVEYLVKLPDMSDRTCILVDPMLATGFSAKYACDVLVRYGCRPENIRFMALVAAPEGVKIFHESYPDVPVYVASLDSHLNENAYIVPGLGDAGDRIFGTV